MTIRRRTNNDRQNIHIKQTEDRVTQTPLKDEKEKQRINDSH
jgi:hypothetical protein